MEELDIVREWPPARGEEGSGARVFRGTRRNVEVFRGRSSRTAEEDEAAAEEDGRSTGLCVGLCIGFEPDAALPFAIPLPFGCAPFTPAAGAGSGGSSVDGVVPGSEGRLGDAGGLGDPLDTGGEGSRTITGRGGDLE